MKKVFSPLFIILFAALPQILSMIYLSATSSILFNSISTKLIIAPIIIIMIVSILFAAYAYIKRKEASTHTSIFIAISVIYTTAIALSIMYGSKLFDSPALMSPILIFIAACMISVIYGIAGIAYNTTPPGKTYDAARYVIGTVFTPLIWFFGFNFISGTNSNALMLILITASILAILFFLAKLLFILRPRLVPPASDAKPRIRYYIAVFIIALCLPLLGLALNRFLTAFDDIPSAGFFGNFSHPMFYIIAALNGLLLLLPPAQSEKQRLLFFYLKSAGYTYILYFFAVFVPLVPIGIIGTIIYGLGLLVLAPLFVTILQGYHLLKEWIILSKSWSKLLLITVFCLGIITIPLVMVSTFWGDKANLATATQYLEQRNFDYSKPVDINRLKRTLNNAKGSLQVSRGFMDFSNNNTPIISQLYNRLILDGKVLSPDNVLALENLFLDAGHDLTASNLSNPNIVNHTVRILDAASETRFDEKTGVYKSWVNLKLKNAASADNGEYIAAFKLPEGAYVSDYYLDVFGTRKQGLLTDRRAALFIYSKIVNTRRDPGLLHYISENTLELRVFPFAPNEVRETGFEIIHSQKFDLTIGSETIALGGDTEQKEIKINGAVLLPASQKAALQRIVRKPEYHFVIDSSKNSDISWHISQIQAYTKANNIKNAEVTFASYKLQHHNLADIANVKYKAESGFNLNMAIKKILSNKDKNGFPIVIAVSDNMSGAVFPRNIYTLSQKFPESPYYYALNHNLTLTPYSYESNKPELAVAEPIVEPIVDYNGTYILDDGKSKLVLTNAAATETALSGNQYQDAVLLDAMQQRAQLEGKADSVDMVRSSFRTKILTPQTAFIVVETNEQERELLDLQERILNNNEDVPTVTLNEPPIIVLIILFTLIMLMLKLKKVKKPFNNCL